MNFRPHRSDAPEINLIPFIDVLLVVLIFLMLSTTYSAHTQLQITLPTADTERQREQPKALRIGVTAGGNYSVNDQLVNGKSIKPLLAAITEGANAGPETVVVISADAKATHQSVVTAMEAARRAGLNRITFAMQSTLGKNTK